MGLNELAPELIHLIALSGNLSYEEACALSLTCKRMANILVYDKYGKDLLFALKGVAANVLKERWRVANFAMARGWDGEGDLNEREKGGMNMGMTALAMACRSGKVEVVEYLLGRGVELGNGYGELAVFAAGEHGDDDLREKMEQACEDAGVDPYGPDESPFLDACAKNYNEVVQLYCDQTSCNWTRGLDVAAENGSADVMQTLLLYNHNEMKPSDSAWAIAVENEDMAVLDVLVEHTVEYGGWAPNSSLELAVEQGQVQVVQRLLDAGIEDIDQADRNGTTLLMFALESGHLEVVRILVAAGANLSVRARGCHYGVSQPLHVAVEKGLVDIVKLLLEHGADPNVEAGEDHVRPVDIIKGNSELYNILAPRTAVTWRDLDQPEEDFGSIFGGVKNVAELRTLLSTLYKDRDAT